MFFIIRMCSLANAAPDAIVDGVKNDCSKGEIFHELNETSSMGYNSIRYDNKTVIAVYYKIITRTCLKKCTSNDTDTKQNKNGMVITETLIKM